MNSNSRGRARIGVLVPFTNTNLEPDVELLRPDGVSMHFARLGGYSAEATPDEEQMAQLGVSDLDEPLRLIAGVQPDVILYGCTSATLTHGRRFDADLSDRIKAGTGAATVTAAAALLHALNTLGLRRVGFASPYIGAINRQAMAFLSDAAVETVRCAEIGRALDNYEQGALTPGEVFDLGCRADHPEAEAIVLSCTDMRSVEAVEPLEAVLGKPVVTSNQAMVFMALQLLDIDPSVVRCGRLFRTAMPASGIDRTV